MKKIKILYEEEEIQGKVFRMYPRGTKLPRTTELRIVHYCKVYEPILFNGDSKPTVLGHHCKYYETS